SVHHFDVDVQAVVNTFLWRTVIHIALTAARRRLDCIHVGLVADGLVENLRCRLPDGLLRLNTFRSTSELRCDVLADGFCFTECCYAPRHFAFSFSAFAVWVVWTLGDRPELHPRSAEAPSAMRLGIPARGRILPAYVCPALSVGRILHKAYSSCRQPRVGQALPADRFNH